MSSSTSPLLPTATLDQLGVWKSYFTSLCTVVYGSNSILQVCQILSLFGSRSSLLKSPALAAGNPSFQDHVSITNFYKHAEIELPSFCWHVSASTMRE